MQVSDIERISEIGHSHSCLVLVNNAFASPYLQRPLELGADVVLHSVTKFINGHADIVGGILVAKERWRSTSVCVRQWLPRAATWIHTRRFWYCAVLRHSDPG